MSNQQIVQSLKSRSNRIHSNTIRPLPVEFAHSKEDVKLWCRYTPWQVLTSLIVGLFFLIVIVTMVSLYMFEAPDLILKSTAMVANPLDSLDLTGLPVVRFKTLANIRVRNPNLLPVPVHLSYKGSFASSNPSERVISGALYNQFLPSRGDLHTAIDNIIMLNLLQDRMDSLTKILDACGMFGGGRSTLKVNIYGSVWLGYGVIAIPIKETIFTGLIIQCPLLEENMGQVILNIVGRLLPFQDQYNNTINDILMGTEPPYLPL